MKMDTPVEQLTFWASEGDGGFGGFETQEEASDWANERFASECQDGNPKNNEVLFRDIDLIHYTHDWEEIERIPVTLSYTHYHGDREEHFRQGDHL